MALAVIVPDGGLSTAHATFRTGLRPAAVLATVGVLVCAGITAAAGLLLFGLDWGTALLMGAVVGITDAAAAFALLTRSGVTLNERVAATREIWSGVNDPVVVYLTLAIIALLAAPPWRRAYTRGTEGGGPGDEAGVALQAIGNVSVRAAPGPALASRVQPWTS